ncbi:MAG: thioredoxin family protein [Methanosarcinales archaeon]|nr:thioredoxin family protein [ANME-2 cluster archaeon]MDF1532454.1 thioredoxin family protein [ANME-2 cluster archaeon]MDW7776867.1 thioredoxin family protein [Methanosarcinales archaeon]
MALIHESDKEKLKKKLDEGLEGNVKLVMFTQENECQFCADTRGMVEELAKISPKIEAEVHDFVKDEKLAKSYGVKLIPAIVMMGEKDYGIRFYGIPSGYEFATFQEDLIDVSRGKTDLSDDVRKKLAGVKKPVHIQVLVTPTCPYCSMAVRTAHKLAIENEHIKADMVEMVEFPHIAQRYMAMSVPKIIINEVTDFVGALPPEHFVDEILKALRSGDNPMYS